MSPTAYFFEKRVLRTRVGKKLLLMFLNSQLLSFPLILSLNCLGVQPPF